MQGCSLREIERKIGWSVGTDHPEKWGKLTYEFVAGKVQVLQIRQVAQRCRDATCVKLNEKQVGQSGTTHPEKREKWT